MVNQQGFTVLTGLLLLAMCSCLQLPYNSKNCPPCTCLPDQEYGGVFANCSNRGLTYVSLPEPGNITTLLSDHNNLSMMAVSEFKGMVNLRHLSLRQNGLTAIEKSNETIFGHMEYLDISDNVRLGLAQVVNIESWLKNKTLKTLRIEYIVSLNPLIVPLEGWYCSFLQNTALMELYLDGNTFFYIGKSCFHTLPTTIEVLSARYTMLGHFIAANLTGLLNFQSLRIIDLTGFVTWNPDNMHYGHWRKFEIPSVIFITRSIEVFRYDGVSLKADLKNLTLVPLHNVLTTLDISDNLIESVIGPFIGFQNVEDIDFSQNRIASVSKTLFEGLNNLKKINVSNNDLGKSIEEDTSGDLLKQFDKLEVLDVSDNKITFLPEHFVQETNNIQYLNLSGNFLTNFDVDIFLMRHLKELDLRNNKLNKLPQRVMKQINLLPDLKVIMDDNPLYCSCDTLEFLEWIRDSQHVQHIDALSCRFTNGSRIQLQFLNHIVSSLHEICKSDLVLIASSVSGAFVLLLFVSGIVVYQHRWKLRYLYYVGRNRYQLLTDEEDLEIYKYDAFISYADKDRTFVIKNLRTKLEDSSGMHVCIHSRDFLPGDIITENIINAIQNSRKTVIVLTPAFLKSEWCIYEFHMARLHGISRKLSNLLVVLLEEVDVKQLPKDLAMMMTNNSYLEYSTDLYGEEVFWNNLTEGIRTTRRME